MTNCIHVKDKEVKQDIRRMIRDRETTLDKISMDFLKYIEG